MADLLRPLCHLNLRAFIRVRLDPKIRPLP
jgi:hypothetical protein